MHTDFCLKIVLFLIVMIAVNSVKTKMFKTDFSPQEEKFISNIDISKLSDVRIGVLFHFVFILMDFHSHRMCNIYLRTYKCSISDAEGHKLWIMGSDCIVLT